MDQSITISYKEIREICSINEYVKDYFEKTYPEVFLFWCEKCKSNYPCSSQNFGIECEEEIKFKV